MAYTVAMDIAEERGEWLYQAQEAIDLARTPAQRKAAKADLLALEIKLGVKDDPRRPVWRRPKGVLPPRPVSEYVFEGYDSL